MINEKPAHQEKSRTHPPRFGREAAENCARRILRAIDLTRPSRGTALLSSIDALTLACWPKSAHGLSTLGVDPNIASKICGAGSQRERLLSCVLFIRALFARAQLTHREDRLAREFLLDAFASQETLEERERQMMHLVAQCYPHIAEDAGILLAQRKLSRRTAA